MKGMIYLLWNDHENPMGCKCCRYTGPEYLHGIFGSKEDALAELEKLALQEDVEPEDRFTPIWDKDKAWMVLGRSEEDYEHAYFVHAYELEIIEQKEK